jgi:hypothetical protein
MNVIHAIHHVRLIEAFCLEIMHQVVGLRWRRWHSAHLALPNNDCRPRISEASAFRGAIFIDAELRCRRKGQYLFEFRHCMHLTAAIQNIHALLLHDHRVAVDVRCALLKFGEVLRRFQRSRQAEDSLDIDAM